MQTKPFRFLDIIIGFFVAVLLISNIASSAKIVHFGPFVYDAGTLLFPLSYIFGDVLTEVYGYSVSRRVIWIGFATLLLMSVLLLVVGVMPGDADWLGANNFGQEAYNKILGLTPRIVAGSLLAFWVGSFANDFIMARLKVITNGKWLWVRTIGSTLIGEGIDTLVFVLVAFAGTMPNDIMWSIVWSNYVFKVGVEILFTPLTYAIVNKLKRVEHVDHYDRDTDFNPFKVGIEGSSGS